MESKCVITLMLLATVALAAARDVKQKRSMLFPGLSNLANMEDNNDDADGTEDIHAADNSVDERELRELAHELKTSVVNRRGIFDCAEMFQTCHGFKRCCGELKCTHFFKKGICLKYM